MQLKNINIRYVNGQLTRSVQIHISASIPDSFVDVGCKLEQVECRLHRAYAGRLSMFRAQIEYLYLYNTTEVRNRVADRRKHLSTNKVS